MKQMLNQVIKKEADFINYELQKPNLSEHIDK